MTERQQHGFAEEDYLEQEYLIDMNDSYTDPWDGYVDEKNLIGVEMDNKNYKFPVSAKTKKINCAVEMADIYRNATIKENFVLTIGFWNDTKTKHVIKRHFLYIPKDEWLKNFPIHSVIKMKNIFVDNEISNKYEDDEKWKFLSKQYKNEWDSLNTGINVHFKRDHKNQKRVQCSIKKDYLKELIKKYSITIKKR